MQMNRLFEIVFLLLNHEQITAKELSARFEVSTRTIYRDIDTLCEAGIPIFTTKGKNGGISLLHNFILDKAVLSKEEQGAILSSLEGLKAINNEDAGEALQKLSSFFGADSMNWIEVDFTDWKNSKEERSKFQIIKQSILEKRNLSFDYNNANGETSHRFVAPLKLVFKSQAWYLYGYCYKRESNRFFKISRILDMHLQEDTHTLPIPEYVLAPLEDENHPPLREETLLLHISKKEAFRVYDEFPSSAITTDEQGDFIITTTFPCGKWIYSYLMSYGNHISVIKPTYIRKKLIQTYKEAIRTITQHTL